MASTNVTRGSFEWIRQKGAEWEVRAGKKEEGAAPYCYYHCQANCVYSYYYFDHSCPRFYRLNSKE